MKRNMGTVMYNGMTSQQVGQTVTEARFFQRTRLKNKYFILQFENHSEEYVTKLKHDSNRYHSVTYLYHLLEQRDYISKFDDDEVNSNLNRCFMQL
jgi:hypothetical protein